MTIDKNKKPNYNFPKLLDKRSQDLDETYVLSGALWIARSPKLIKYRTFYLPNHQVYPLDWISAIDIDTYDDLKIAKIACAFAKEK